MYIVKEAVDQLMVKKGLKDGVKEVVLDALGYGILGRETHEDENVGDVQDAVYALEDPSFLEYMYPEADDQMTADVDSAHTFLSELLK